MLNQAVILAGGRGERLRPLTDTLPKPMAPINNFPFLDYLIKSIIDAKIKNILILVGYKSEAIIDRYSNINNINIEFSYSDEESFTGTRVINAYEKLQNHFLLMYGDNYWPIAINNMWNKYLELDVKILTTVFSNINGTGEYKYENNILVDKNSKVIKYDKKRKNKQSNGVDIGYFIVSKKTLIESRNNSNFSFEESLLPKFIQNNELGAYITDSQYYFITNYNTIKEFEKAIIRNNFRPLSTSYFEESLLEK
jgi:NDP-sugar pyrophosphorylase family protein